MKKYPYLEPIAKKAILYVSKIEGTIIIMTVDGFNTKEDALRLKDMLHYAQDKEVEIRIVPKNTKPPKGIRFAY